MSDEQMDDILRELRDELNTVRPSPEFAAKVRAQVAKEPARRWFGAWQLGLGMAAAVVIAAIVWPRSGGVIESPQPVAVVATPPRPSAPEVPAPVVRTVERAAPRVVAAASVLESREPEVLVPAGERIALERFLAGLKAGKTGDVPAGVTLFDETTGELTVPKLIEIQPIVVEPLAGTTDPRGGGRSQQ